MSEFRIATTSGGLAASGALLSTILAGYDKHYEPQWSFIPQSAFYDNYIGGRFSEGYPLVTWKWGALRFEQRQLLRAFCTGLSTTVFIKTVTNETISGVRQFASYEAVMNWRNDNELIGINYVEQVEIMFTHCVAL
jgi:hypothetical protein